HELTDDCEVEWAWQEAEDWSREWRRGLKPRRMGRIVVSPSWLEPDAQADDILLVIDPEMAFGTGEHATTRGCLRLLQQCVRTHDRVLDVGTGSAILAIAAARLGATDVVGVEMDADAIENARDNVVKNGVSDVVRIEHALVDGAYLATHGAFDLVMGNVLSSVLTPLLPWFRRALTSGGRLILSCLLEP